MSLLKIENPVNCRVSLNKNSILQILKYLISANKITDPINLFGDIISPLLKKKVSGLLSPLF